MKSKAKIHSVMLVTCSHKLRLFCTDVGNTKERKKKQDVKADGKTAQCEMRRTVE